MLYQFTTPKFVIARKYFCQRGITVTSQKVVALCSGQVKTDKKIKQLLNTVLSHTP